MIDCENDVFNAVANKVKSKYPDAYMSGEYVKSPPHFPAISLVMMDSSVYERTQTSDGIENHVEVMFETDIYSNKKSGKKSECKAIAALIDDEFAALGFSRMMLQPIPNMDDATIYRMKGRYRGVVSKDNMIFRR